MNINSFLMYVWDSCEILYSLFDNHIFLIFPICYVVKAFINQN
jgi:hypothetical protein